MRQLAVLRAAGLPVSVGATIHRHNAAEVEAIVELVASKGAERPYIGPMYPAGRATALNDLVVSGEQWDLAVDQYVNVVKARESKLLNELRSYTLQENEFDGLDVRTVASKDHSSPGHADELELVKLPKRLSA
jgi:MoaA/NifB/PqqE/SkfB family radical SAM enzyme